MIQAEGIFVGGGEATKSYTLEIKTDNPKSNVDYVFYYNNARTKTTLYLTTSYQTITFCDGFFELYRGGDNISAVIELYDADDNSLTSIDIPSRAKYGMHIAPTGLMLLNMSYLLEDYPNIKKIRLHYMD